MVTPLSDRYLLLKEQRPDIKPTEMLQVLAQEVGLNNLSYLGFHKTNPGNSDPVIHTTYDPAWLTRYQEETYAFTNGADTSAASSPMRSIWAV